MDGLFIIALHSGKIPMTKITIGSFHAIFDT